MHTSLSARITLWVNRFIMAVLVILAIIMPQLLLWYATLRPMGMNVPYAIAIAFYICLPAVGWALWAMERIIRRILTGDIFVTENVRSIRQIRWCCVAVGLITFVDAFFYPPMVLIFVIMSFLALVVNLVGQVMKAAVEIREENDLTV